MEAIIPRMVKTSSSVSFEIVFIVLENYGITPFLYMKK